MLCRRTSKPPKDDNAFWRAIMTYTYLTTEELSARIKYDSRTIRNQLKDSIFIEGTHYIRPFGGRKLLFLWEPIVEELHKHSVFFESFHG